MKLTIISFICLSILVACNSADDGKGFEFKYGDSVTTLSDHPRLFFSKDEEAGILELAKKEPLLSSLIVILRQQAEKTLSLPLQEPNEIGEASLGKSREQISRILILSLAWRLLDDDRYAGRAEEELINVCKFKSWHPEHFLDVAEMTTAVAIGYDWCFSKLSPETRSLVEQAIREKAFAPAWPVYEKGDNGSWAKRNTNWNVVCNSGLVNGALAIAETCPEDAARIIQYAVQYAPNNIMHFAPGGVYYEGPAYWEYTTSFLMLLINNLSRNLGTDFGLSDMAGVRETGLYYIHSMSPTRGVFNFADAHGEDATYTPVYFFFSRKYNQPELAEFYRTYLQEAVDGSIATGKFSFPRFFFLCIPWFDEVIWTGETDNQKLKIFKGEPDILVFDGERDNPDELFLIAKGGDPDMAHNQLDVGAFIVESQKIRWGIDVGSESYGLPSFWDYKPDGVRWHYFRNTNLAHSTLNIDGKIAHSRGTGSLLKWNAGLDHPFGIFEMSSSYTDQATSVLRGFRMLSPEIIMIRDETTLKNGSEEANWRFITDATVEAKGTYITLTKNGKFFYLYPYPEGKHEIRTFEAKTNSPSENPLTGVTVVEISAKADPENNTAISVIMGSDLVGIKQFPVETIPGLKDWK